MFPIAAFLLPSPSLFIVLISFDLNACVIHTRSAFFLLIFSVLAGT